MLTGFCGILHAQDFEQYINNGIGKADLGNYMALDYYDVTNVIATSHLLNLILILYYIKKKMYGKNIRDYPER